MRQGWLAPSCTGLECAWASRPVVPRGLRCLPRVFLHSEVGPGLSARRLEGSVAWAVLLGPGVSPAHPPRDLGPQLWAGAGAPAGLGHVHDEAVQLDMEFLRESPGASWTESVFLPPVN